MTEPDGSVTTPTRAEQELRVRGNARIERTRTASPSGSDLRDRAGALRVDLDPGSASSASPPPSGARAAARLGPPPTRMRSDPRTARRAGSRAAATHGDGAGPAGPGSCLSPALVRSTAAGLVPVGTSSRRSRDLARPRAAASRVVGRRRRRSTEACGTRPPARTDKECNLQSIIWARPRVTRRRAT
jgi:hypothetical protein